MAMFLEKRVTEDLLAGSLEGRRKTNKPKGRTDRAKGIDDGGEEEEERRGEGHWQSTGGWRARPGRSAAVSDGPSACEPLKALIDEVWNRRLPSCIKTGPIST